MEENTPPLRPEAPPDGTSLRVEPAKESVGARIKRALGPVGAAVALLFGKLKFILVAVIKFLPLILKTGGTMILSIGAYALFWGWKFALGFVLLIFIHECGHLVVARRFGLKVSAPMFIPFMGALIVLKDAPRNAWMEACVGIGGPLFGALGSALCCALSWPTQNPLFLAIAYSGFFLNLFNLVPISPLDGGRIATAISPWLWVAGLGILAVMVVTHFNLMLLLILIVSLPRLFSLFRPKSEEDKRYFEVTPWQRWGMAALYFGLMAALVAGMHFTHVELQSP
jgi:Zn-dependent protease